VLVPTHVKDLDKIQEVACGSMHTLARSEDGGVWASGCNHFGQLVSGYYTSQSMILVCVKL